MNFATVRLALSVAIEKGHYIEQLDVKTAFLHGDIDKEVFVLPLKELKICPPGKVLRLHKGLYGLKQSPELWNDKWKDEMSILKFRSINSDSCVFRRGSLWLLLYVDDIVVISPSQKDLDGLKTEISRHVDVKPMGTFGQFLGVTFIGDQNGAWLSQAQYTSQVLNRFGMENCKPVKTPMVVKGSAQEDSSSADKQLYQEIIGSLLFLSTRTRPDISAAVGLLCRHSSSTSSKNLTAAKRVLRYLQGTKTVSLRLSKTGSKPTLRAFSDADWAGDRGDRKTTSGSQLMFSNSSIAWRTLKQSVTALSSTEAEFIAASETWKLIVWM